MNTIIPAITLQRVEVPQWKKFWTKRDFSDQLIEKKIIKRRPPDVIKNIFHTGPYFFIVADYRDMTVQYMEGIEKMLGYSSQQVYNGNIEFIVNLIHPDDKDKVLGLAVSYYNFLDEQPAEKRLDFKASINFRFRKADGRYLRVLEQVISLETDGNGMVTHALKYFTDISHLKYSNEVIFSIMNDRSEDHQFYTVNFDGNNSSQGGNQTKSVLSVREIEILTMIALGKTSKEIATELCISNHTVNKHRENIMHKTCCKNMSEVISFAHCNDYL
jgi:DNA-binding CsgD family transcriptional regulator